MAGNKSIIDKIKSFPEKPGVYVFKNSSGEVLYAGKAKNLRKRVLSYFQKTELRPFLTALLKNVSQTEYIVTQNENEALILESNLIKRFKPRYNIVLKDDKNYLFVKIGGNDFPRLELVRKITDLPIEAFLSADLSAVARKAKAGARRTKAGLSAAALAAEARRKVEVLAEVKAKVDKKARYFGPFTNARALRRTIKTLKKIFPYQKCSLEIEIGKTKRKRTCLYYSLGQCLGHCAYPTEKLKKDYKKAISRIIEFFKGNFKEIIAELQKEMEKESKYKNFEKAALIRNQIFALQKISSPQIVYFTKPLSADAISISQEKEKTAINIFVIRQGKIIDKKNFLLKNLFPQNEKEILESFLREYYDILPKDLLPKEIWLPQKVSSNIEGVKILAPRRGKKRKIIHLGRENALFFLREKLGINDAEIKKSLKELRQTLKIKNNLSRIEAFDVSNISGFFATGSMIVFKNGAPEKSEYRKFRLRCKAKPNDTKMMAETLSRRFLNKKWAIPDLIIVDGGKPQLFTALKKLNENKVKAPAIALAKRKEEIFVPEKKESIRLPKSSEALKLLQRIRDEAHRFTVSYHRGLRGKIPSALDEIPGIGPKRKKALMQKFGSISAIKKAKIAELAKVANKKIALIIKEKL